MIAEYFEYACTVFGWCYTQHLPDRVVVVKDVIIFHSQLPVRCWKNSFAGLLKMYSPGGAKLYLAAIVAMQ